MKAQARIETLQFELQSVQAGTLKNLYIDFLCDLATGFKQFSGFCTFHHLSRSYRTDIQQAGATKEIHQLKERHDASQAPAKSLLGGAVAYGSHR